MDKFAFLYSTRFWALVCIVAVMIASDNGLLTYQTAQYVYTLLGGFVTVRTVDRFAEKSGSVDTGTI